MTSATTDQLWQVWLELPSQQVGMMFFAEGDQLLVAEAAGMTKEYVCDKR